MNIVSFEKYIPIALMTLDVGAGIVYLIHGDVKRFVYWLAAATLTACVTF